MGEGSSLRRVDPSADRQSQGSPLAFVDIVPRSMQPSRRLPQSPTLLSVGKKSSLPGLRRVVEECNGHLQVDPTTFSTPEPSSGDRSRTDEESGVRSGSPDSSQSRPAMVSRRLCRRHLWTQAQGLDHRISNSSSQGDVPRCQNSGQAGLLHCQLLPPPGHLELPRRHLEL